MNRIFTIIVMSMLTFILYACGGGGSGISISNVSSDGVNAVAEILKNSTSATSSAAVILSSD